MIGFDPRGVFAPSLLGLAAAALLVGGCGGGSTYSLDQADLAQRFLPTERTVAYPPDSLGSLTISKKKGTYEYELADDYEALHRKWSCTYQDVGRGQARRPRSYATLWSLELALASLQPDFGITVLSENRAEKKIKERRQEFKSTLRVDVYWFEAEGESNLTSPGTRVELRIGDDTYRPDAKDSGPLREAFLSDRATTALYRRNSFYFRRVVDGTDILREAQGMELRINPGAGGSRIRFAWSWETSS